MVEDDMVYDVETTFISLYNKYKDVSISKELKSQRRNKLLNLIFHTL